MFGVLCRESLRASGLSADGRLLGIAPLEFRRGDSLLTAERVEQIGPAAFLEDSGIAELLHRSLHVACFRWQIRQIRTLVGRFGTKQLLWLVSLPGLPVTAQAHRRYHDALRRVADGGEED